MTAFSAQYRSTSSPICLLTGWAVLPARQAFNFVMLRGDEGAAAIGETASVTLEVW